jgi:P27 family predicted phage terminase small subunit
MGKRGPMSNAAAVRKATIGNSEPQMPNALAADAKQEWERVTDLLRERTMLDALDETALTDYITCWQRLRECEADIAARGVLIEGGGGRGAVKNPACQLSRQYRDHLISWCKEFGFTPNSRTRMAMPAPVAQDGWDKF